MMRTLYALWVGLGLVASAIWSVDDCSDNEADKANNRG